MPEGRVPYEYLTPAEKTAIMAWLDTHRIDPRRTPVGALLEYDPVHREWRIEQYWHDDRGRMLVDDTGDDVRRVVVRRRSRSRLPWPTWGRRPLTLNSLKLNGVDLTPYVTEIRIGES